MSPTLTKSSLYPCTSRCRSTCSTSCSTSRRRSAIHEHLENKNIKTPIQRWIWVYRVDRLLVNINTNNGTERQNESFKYSYLQRKSLTGMLSMFIDEFLINKFSWMLLLFAFIYNKRNVSTIAILHCQRQDRAVCNDS